MTIETEKPETTRLRRILKRFTRPVPAVLIAAAVITIQLNGWLSVVDNGLSDLGFELNSRPATGDLVLVAIDPKSIEKLEIWPWPRRFHARVIDNLLAAGATRVAMDIDFSARSHPDEDRILEDAITRARSRVILPVFNQMARNPDGSYSLKQSAPLQAFRDTAPLASVNVQPDSNGLIRRMVVYDNNMPSLAAALSMGSGHIPQISEFHIDYGIKPSTIPQISYSDILLGQFDPKAVAGKQVLIGSTAVELGDQLAVPVYKTVPGPTIHILAYESLIQGRALLKPIDAVAIAAVLLLIFGFGAILKNLSWRAGAAVAAIGIASVLVIAYALQVTASVLTDTAPMLLAIVLTFFWSVARRTDQQALRLVFQSIDMRRKDAMMRHVVQNSFDGIVTIEPSGLIKSVNPAAAKIFEYNDDSIVGRHVGWLFPELATADSDEQLTRMMHVGEALHELQGHRGTNTDFPAEVSANMVETDDQPIITVFIRDITERKQQQNKLIHQASHDALTGLPNRVQFQERLAQAITDAERLEINFAVLLLDLDRFKEVNDTLGHPTGDRLLEQIAARLNSIISRNGIIARFGGDEFAVLLPFADDTEMATEVSQQILSAVCAPYNLANLTLEVGGSIGIAMYPEHGDDHASLIKCADVAMYNAKEAQSGFAIYDSEKDVNSIRYLTLAGDLRRAIAENELAVFFQPKIGLKSNRIVATEALVRWIHPEHGFISPDDFIDKAEQTGVIREMTEWVLNRSLDQMTHWRRMGYEIDVAVNMSARLLNDQRIVTLVAEALQHRQVPPSSLILEVTENAMMSDPATAMAVINSLSDLGVRISIDDFGTGYSSLGYLKDLKANELKIDKSFVMAIHEDPGNEAIVRSTIGMAHSLGMKVVAEGIETREIRDLLERMNCNVGQGYLFSKPLPAEEFDQWLTQSEWSGYGATSSETEARVKEMAPLA